MKIKTRHIRIFISSTFRDMHAERDYLIKYTFPELRKRCYNRGLELTEVDLRWGVTEEQAENGEVLPICLNEIENSRPYFIGLLGERYGWVPPKDKIHPTLLKRQQWLEEHLNKSVTEMEILHGVLNNPGMVHRAFFYFRNPAFLESLDKNQLTDYKEEDPELLEKLRALKQKIKTAGFPVKENYNSVAELGQCIVEDLWKSIDADYPASEIPDPIEKEALEHEQWAESRRKVYIGRQEYFTRLNGHAMDSNVPLIIKGESGSGKTALLANWVEKYRNGNPQDLVIQHYIGSSLQSADYIHFLSRIMKELQRKFTISDDFPVDAEEIKNNFPKWLYMASQQGKVVLVIDGLNQLEDRDNALNLYWLPDTIPENIRLIVSIIPGEIEKTLQKKNWQEYSVSGLNRDEQQSLIEEYLGQFTKKLDAKQVQILLDAKQTENPLFLKVLLDELKIFGIHEELLNKIHHYLTATKVDELYGLILERLEMDYEKDRPKLVTDALTCIWVSRYGLSETELLDLLGSNNSPLPRAIWSPLYLALEESIVIKNGLLNFSHDYLRKAIYDRYIKNTETKHELHFGLAQYFFSQETNNRKLEELPWQCIKAMAYKALYQLLSNIEIAVLLWQKQHFDFKLYWTVLEKYSEYRITTAYEKVIREPEKFNIEHVGKIAAIFQSFSYLEHAYLLASYMYKIYAENNDFEKLKEESFFVYTLLTGLGKYNDALRFAKQYENLCEKLSDTKGLGNAYSILANSYHFLEDYDRAQEYYVRCHEHCTKLNDQWGLAINYTNWSNYYEKNEEYEKGLQLAEKALSYAKKMNNTSLISPCLNDIGLLYSKMGNPNKALEIHKEDEKLSLLHGDKEALKQCYCNTALAYDKLHDFKSLMFYKDKELKLLLGFASERSIGYCLSDIGEYLNKYNHKTEALNIFEQAEDMLKKSESFTSLIHCIKYRLIIYKEQENFEKALDLAKYYIEICKDLDWTEELAMALSEAINLQKTLGLREESISLLAEAEQVYTSLGKKDSVQIYTFYRGFLLYSNNKNKEALEVFEKDEQLCRELNNMQALSQNLQLQSDIYAIDDFENANRKLEESEQILLTIKDFENLYRNINKHCKLALKWSRFDLALEAMNKQLRMLKHANANEETDRVYNKQIQLLTEINNKPKLAECLNSYAIFLKNNGQPERALEVHKQEEKIGRELSDDVILCYSLINQSSILRNMTKHADALTMFDEIESLCEKTNNMELQQACLLQKADSLRSTGNINKAASSLEQLIELSRSINDKPVLATSLGKKALLLNELKLPEEAYKLQNEEEKICKEIGDNQKLYNCYFNKVTTLLHLNKIEETIALLNKIEELAKENEFEVPEVLTDLKKGLLNNGK